MSVSHHLRCVALRRAAELWVGWALCATAASAHQSGNSYLTVNDAGGGVSVQIDFSVKDLNAILQIPGDEATAVTPATLAARRQRLSETVQQRLHLEADGRALQLDFVAQSVTLRNDGLYVRQAFAAREFPALIGQLVVRYDFFSRDESVARAYARLALRGAEISSVFDARHTVQRFALRDAARFDTAALFVREGAWHIWGGADHLLFLLCLLLPGLALIGPARPSRWPSIRPALLFALSVVTAFTVAHSITLAAAALGWVRLPDRWVEAVIALSIMVCAVLNLAVAGHKHHWQLAFGFGLIHGLGFANGLRELGLSHGHFLETLLAFNVGVELGQLAILAGVCALLLPWAHRPWLRARLLPWGSALALPVAGVWLTQRLLA